MVPRCPTSDRGQSEVRSDPAQTAWRMLHNWRCGTSQALFQDAAPHCCQTPPHCATCTCITLPHSGMTLSVPDAISVSARHTSLDHRSLALHTPYTQWLPCGCHPPGSIWMCSEPGASLQATRPRPRVGEAPIIHAAMTHIDTRQRRSHMTSPPASACQTVVDLRAIPKRDAPCAMAHGEEKPPPARDGQGATARSHP